MDPAKAFAHAEYDFVAVHNIGDEDNAAYIAAYTMTDVLPSWDRIPAVAADNTRNLRNFLGQGSCCSLH